jgi:hypothetical protein
VKRIVLSMVQGALVAALTCVPVVATAQSGPFADLDNDGRLGPGDVAIGSLLADGRFSTAESEGDYVAPAGPVSVVIEGKKIVLKGKSLVVIASGDLTVNASLMATTPDTLVLLVSTGGKITFGPDVRVNGGDFVKLSADGDIDLGNGCALTTKGRDFGDVVSVVSMHGNITIGTQCTLSGGGLLQVATPDDGGGQITIGGKSKLSAGEGNVQVTSGLDLTLDGVTISGPGITLGSHASIHSPGHAMIRGSQLRAGGADGRIRIYADGGTGSMVDLTDTRMRISDTGTVDISADQIVNP